MGSTKMEISGSDERKAADRPKVVGRSPAQRSRIGNGKELLPSVDGRSVWARLLRDTMDAMARHLGGIDQVSEVQRLSIRRVAALEAELIHLEGKFARARQAGGEPDAADLDLYARLGNAQRRHLEPLGWQSVPRDVTNLGDLLAQDAPQKHQETSPVRSFDEAATPLAGEGK